MEEGAAAVPALALAALEPDAAADAAAEAEEAEVAPLGVAVMAAAAYDTELSSGLIHLLDCV